LRVDIRRNLYCGYRHWEGPMSNMSQGCYGLGSFHRRLRRQI
jgi:hypothetical protein